MSGSVGTCPAVASTHHVTTVLASDTTHDPTHCIFITLLSFMVLVSINMNLLSNLYVNETYIDPLE